MTTKHERNIITTIEKQLTAASNDYYNSGTSKLSDSEFDALREQLKKLDPSNPFFSKVGAPAHRDKVKLLMHMGSQNKAKDETEFAQWYKTVDQPELVISDKLDGSSVEVLYRNGKLLRVATRGDGIVGMDITRNAKLWPNLPHVVVMGEGLLIVRGEAQLSASKWKEEFPNTANPRNAGNGIIVCDSDNDRNRFITFHAFDLVYEAVEFKTQDMKFEALESMGFSTSRWSLTKSWGDILALRNQYIVERPTLDFEIDGMVAAVNDLAVQEHFGYSDGGTRPNGQIAWKFETEKAITKVTSIILTIGHTGKIIPKATLEPITLAGTTVKNVLLNNFDYIASKNINVGDEVEIEKGGDIIPHCTRVVTKLTTGPYPPPTDWKGYPLVKEGSDWKVVDDSCPDLAFQRISNWVSKTGIKQLGDSALLALTESGLVTDVHDLYALDEDAVSKLPVGNGVIGGNAKKIIKEIAKTKSMTIDIFIGSLSIKHLGRSRASLLTPHGFTSIESYLKAKSKDLEGKPCSETGTYSAEVAKAIVESIAKRFSTISNLANCIEILQTITKPVSGPLASKRFCFSGVRLKGSQKEQFEALGGVDLGKVNKDTTHLVVKDPSSTSSKVVKAQKLGVAVISLEEFEAFLTL